MYTKKSEIRVNMTLKGEIAEKVEALRKRGIVVSVSDAVRQGILSLSDKVMERDRELARLQTYRDTMAKEM